MVVDAHHAHAPEIADEHLAVESLSGATHHAATRDVDAVAVAVAVAVVVLVVLEEALVLGAVANGALSPQRLTMTSMPTPRPPSSTPPRDLANSSCDAPRA